MTITYVDNCADNGSLYTATGDIDMSTSVLKHPVLTKLFETDDLTSLPTVVSDYYNRYICGELSATLIHASRDGDLTSGVTSADFLTLNFTSNRDGTLTANP